jgi:hypothetical protein
MSAGFQARAWIFLSIPPLVWYGHQQGLGGPLRLNCHVAEGPTALTWGAVSLLLCAANAWLALPLAREGQDTAGPMTPWIGRLAVAASGLFGLAILFGSLASALVPACAR